MRPLPEDRGYALCLAHAGIRHDELALSAAAVDLDTRRSLPVTAANRQLSITSVNAVNVNGNIVLGDAAAARVLTLTGVATSNVGVNGIIQDGAVAGGALSISGGIYTFTSANTFSGGTTLFAGTVNLANDAALGTEIGRAHV